MDQIINTKLQEKRLEELKSGMVSGMFAEQERKKKIQRITALIQHALFLQGDNERKQRWLAVLNQLGDQFLDQLLQAIIRENFRFQKKERDIKIELNTRHSPVFTNV